MASYNDSDDDCTLQELSSKLREARNVLDENIIQNDFFDGYDSDKDPAYFPESEKTCKALSCTSDIFKSCITCSTLLCFEHFNESNGCLNHLNNNVEENLNETLTPESFLVDGERIESDHEDIEVEPIVNGKKRGRITNEIREKRLKGLSYSTKAGNLQQARNALKEQCNTSKCSNLNLECQELNEAKRFEILTAFRNLKNLASQRTWISNHITIEIPKVSKDGSRKKRNINYFLPIMANEEISVKLKVCRTMFLNTLNIPERQVRTVLEKIDENGVLEEEKRGGRRKHYIARDEKLKKNVVAHINRFPRIESHYCRATTSKEYLSSELSISTMYDMYAENEKNNLEDVATYEYYRKTFSTMKLGFHRPKKDLCGICENYIHGTEEQKKVLKANYDIHRNELKAVRKIKDNLKEKSLERTSNFFVASFDLQQVIYLPQSKRNEVFYKRRFATYNFTVYNSTNKEGHCYYWNESIAKKGANEIASCLYSFLMKHDKYDRVFLFCDGCAGQNKNSILPAMLMEFLNNSQNIQEITMHFFETNHGQSEGDSMHSAIQRAISKRNEILVPSQVALLLHMARKSKPYFVTELNTKDVKNWKLLSSAKGILKVRKSVEGEAIDWTKVMQLKCKKDAPNSIFFKMSHLTATFFTLDLSSDSIRNSNADAKLENAYCSTEELKISKAKYLDLISLCEGANPLIEKREVVLFYKSLPH